MQSYPLYNAAGLTQEPVFPRKDHPGEKNLEKNGSFPPRKRAANVEKNTYDHIWQHPRPIYCQLLYASTDIFKKIYSSSTTMAYYNAAIHAAES